MAMHLDESDILSQRPAASKRKQEPKKDLKKEKKSKFSSLMNVMEEPKIASTEEDVLNNWRQPTKIAEAVVDLVEPAVASPITVEVQVEKDEHIDWDDRPDYSQFDFYPNEPKEIKEVTGNELFAENLDAKSMIQNSFSLFSNPSPWQPPKKKKAVFLVDDVSKTQDDLFPLYMDTDSPVEISHKSRSTASIPPPPPLNSVRYTSYIDIFE
jgi:hypothetical protein